MDSYALCPCGSGKKVKFCCQAILPDMARIERLQENNQPRMALQLIDKLRKDHPQNAWLATQRAMALLNENELPEARDTLVTLLRQQPEHPLANALLGLVISELEPVEKAKKVIHRAFLKSMQSEPRMVALLAKKLAEHFLDEQREMAARQHLAVASRLEDEQEQQRDLMGILELDGDISVAYPLRGSHPLPQYEPSAANQAAYRKAQRLFTHGCFAEAADQLDQIAAAEAPSASLQHQIALFRAWDGEHAAAAKGFRAASKLTTDFDRAVELETLAQLLEHTLPEHSVRQKLQSYKLESLSRLLTRLDNDDRFLRMPEGVGASGAAAAYTVLDRHQPPEGEVPQITLETCPRSMGEVSLFDGRDDQPAVAIVSGVEGSRFDVVQKTFLTAAGELAQTAPSEEDAAEVATLVQFPRLELEILDSIVPPQGMPSRQQDELKSAASARIANQTWMNTPQPALGGISPAQAAGQDSLKIALAAAVNVLDCVFDRRGSLNLDREALTGKLRVPAAQPLPTGEMLEFTNVRIPALLRSDLSSLSSEDFDKLLERAMVVKHSQLIYRMLSAFVDRSSTKPEDSQKVITACYTLSRLCAASQRRQESLDWLDRGYQTLKQGPADFQQLMSWRLRELTVRAQDREDPDLKPLLLELWNQFGAKVPQLRAQLQEYVQALGIEAPWASAIITPETVGSGAMGWSAEPQQAGGGEKKLWLPD